MEKQKNIALVSLFVERTTQSVPMGAACLMAAVKTDPLLSELFQPQIIEGLIYEKNEILVERIASASPVIVGFSLYVWNLDKVLEVTRLFSKKYPQVLLLAGGPQVTALPEQILDLQIFSYVISGEGESGFSQFLKNLDLQNKALGHNTKSIAGVWEAGRKPELHNCYPIDPTLLPSPWLNNCLSVGNYDGLLWEMARGCPFKCAFCYESRGPGLVRKIPLKRLSKELDFFIREKADLINVLDPTFNADPKRAAEILRMLKLKAPGIRFTFEVRAEFLDAEQAELFSQLHCSVQIGIQTTAPQALKNIGRTFNEQLFREKIGLMNQSGAVFGFDLIYGIPGDTLASFHKSLDFALQLQPNHMDIFPLNVLPGTVLWDTAEELGLEFERTPPYRAVSSPGFNEASREKASNTHRACDLFYTQGRAVAWFLPIIRTLKKKPSVFLDDFYTWAFLNIVLPKEIEPDSLKIEELQLRFVRAELEQAGLLSLFAGAEDLIRFHGAYGRAKIEAKATTVYLNYHPDLVLTPAGMNLKAFCGSHKPRRSGISIKPTRNGIDLEYLKSK